MTTKQRINGLSDLLAQLYGPLDEARADIRRLYPDRHKTWLAGPGNEEKVKAVIRGVVQEELTRLMANAPLNVV